MKKMYFFLSLCLAMIGLTANAQIASLSELSNEKCYAVSNARTSWATSATALKTIKDLGLTADETSPAQQFAFVTNDEGATYYLYSVGQEKFVNLDGSLGNKPVNPINFKQSGSKFVMYFDASHYINCGGSSQMIIDGWNIADEGNMCDIKAVADFDPTAALAKFNSVDEAEVAANLEAAEAALAKAGVGYPTADCGTRTALVAAVDAAKAQVTAETASALSAALKAFLAETNVTLPETGKYYTFTMVAKNGNKFYLNYTGADVAMTPVTGEELPESAKFLATANGDGTYTFQTSDGNYLVYHTKYAGVNWLEGGGNTTGFQAEKDDMTNITLAKLSAAATNVAATDAQVFGLVSWYGKRGYDTGKNEDAMGYMVLKTDGTDFDGANAPFWNDNFSSAFLVEETEVAAVEPVLPLELVSIEPADGANITEFNTVTFTFNKPIKLVESEDTGVLLMFNGGMAGQLWGEVSEDGKTAVLSMGMPVNYEGTYTVYAMEGAFEDLDGNKSAEIMVNYTLAGAADGFTYTYAAPTTDKVQSSLKNITLGFASAVATVKTDALNVVDGEGNVVTTATVAADDMDDQAVVVTLAEEVVYTGTYSLTVPAQFVTSALGTYNPEFTLTYTVEGLEKPSAVDYTPRHTGAKTNTGRPMTSVKVGEQEYTLTAEEQAQCYVDATAKVTFKIEAGAEVALVANTTGSWIHNAVFIDTDANGFVGAIEEGSQYLPAGDLVSYSFYNNGSSSDASGWNSKGDVVTGDNRNRPALPAFTAPTTPGTYRMRFTQDWCSIDPAGDADGLFGDFMANGGQILDVLLEVVEATPEVPTTVESVDPACGNYEVMPSTITVKFSQEVSAITYSRIHTDVGTDAYTLKAEDLQLNGKEVTFTVPTEYVNGARTMLIMLAVEDVNGNPVSYSSNENTAIEGYVMLEYTAESKPATTPLELVSVDPADGAELESVSKFTFTFNKPVTLGEEGGVVLYVNEMHAGQLWGEVSEEDAKVVTFVTEKEFSNSGKYMLYVAPATFVDADGNTNEEMMLNYQVKAAANSFTYAYVTPAQHQVQKSLKVLTIGFIGEVQDVVSSKSINVVDADGKTVTTAKLGLDDYDWNAVIVTFNDEITDPGQYSITIPEEYVFSWEQTYNPEFTLTFTIEGEKPAAKPLEIVSVDPAKGSVIEKFDMVKVTFNQEVRVNKMFGAEYFFDGTYIADAGLYVDPTDPKTVIIDTQGEYKNKGTWGFSVQQGAIVTLDGTECESFELTYEVADITGINGIFAEHKNDVYTLDGRKVVLTPGQKIKKGLYIVGGKKVLVK